MATFEYSVDGQSITTTKAGRLVSGTIGVNTVKFTFDSSWDGLEKWATFDPNPGKPYKQPLDANGECLIPGEVMGGITLRIGAFGLADGQAYPTVWANKLTMEEGCFIEVPVSDWPEPSPVIEEILEELENKVDKPENATPGNVAIIGSNGNIVDGGKSLADIYDAAMISKTASGSIVTIEDGADGVPVKEMTVNIQPVQDGSGDPSPSNVRSIHGWDGVSIRRTAKNLCGGEAFKTDLVKAMPNIALDETAKTATFYANATYTESSLFDIKWKPQTQYTFVIAFSKSSNDATNIRIYYTDGTYTNLGSAYGSYHTKLVQANLSAANKTISKVAKVYQSGATTLYYDECGVFEGVLTVSDFEPYVGNTYEIEFPSEAGTVYGGELTVNEDGSGTLTVDKALAVFDGSTDETITKINNSYANRYTINLPSDALSVAISSRDIAFNWVRSTSSSYDYVGQLISNKRADLYFPLTDTNLDTIAHVRTYLSSNNLQVAYPLDTPVTYTLTAPQVKTLLGLNNIWADTGDISVTYRADLTISAEEKAKAIKASIAYLQDDFTAVRPYVVNDLVYVGDTLYIVSSSIAQGATMTPNTNCAETTLNAVIKSLR